MFVCFTLQLLLFMLMLVLRLSYLLGSSRFVLLSILSLLFADLFPSATQGLQDEIFTIFYFASAMSRFSGALLS